MILFAISVLLIFETASSQFNITKIGYKQTVKGKTNGDLIPLLYEMIPINDTRPFGVIIILSNEERPIDDPISLTAMRGASVLTTSLPRTQTYEGISTRFPEMSEMLCEERNLKDETFTMTDETVRIAVSSSVPAQFMLLVEPDFGYVLRIGHPVKKYVLPIAPYFSRFSFPRGLDTVAIRVRSIDDHCGRVTIQKADCPVFDTEGQVVLYNKYEHQTITRKGYIIVSRTDFGDHIHIITSVLPVEKPCRSKNGPPIAKNATAWKHMELKVIPFQPNKTSIYMLLELFVVLLGVAAGLGEPENNAILLYDENNENDEDSILNGTTHFWTYTLSQIYTVIPLAVVLVSLRDSEFLLSSDTDMYTLAMLMTIVEAKLLLFGKRNGRNIKHYRIIGCLTMMLMTLHALEKNIEPNFWSYVWHVGILCVEALYVFYFSHAHGVTEDEIRNVEIVEMHQSSSNQLEPVNNEYTPVTQNAPAVVIPAIESEQDSVILNCNVAGSSSQNVVEVEVETEQNAEIERNGSRQNLVPVDEIEDPEVRRNLTKHFKKAYLISGLINILFWVIFFWYDSSVIILRVVQTDFAIYFLLYYLNKISYEKVFKRSFYGLTVLFALFIIAWGIISAYYLPAFVPWSPAESRTLNKTCFSVNHYCLGMDWHDILHFVTAAICFFFMKPLLVFLFFVVPSCLAQKGLTIIQFDTFYRNLTTNGNLDRNLYEVQTPANDSRPYAVRAVLVSKDKSLSNDTVLVSVSSSVPARYDLKIKQVHGFVINMTPISVALSPSEPVFYRFSFPEFVDEVAIRVSSSDQLCGRVTVQKADCPVFDTEGQVVLYDSYDHQTFTKKSFITVNRQDFGEDIHIIFSVLPIGGPCRTNHCYDDENADDYDIEEIQFRIKNVTAQIRPFRPNRPSLLFILFILIILFGFGTWIAWYLYIKDNNYNGDDRNADNSLWNTSLSRMFSILPTALIVVVKHYDSHLAKDTDMCNFNFECAVPWGPFRAANNMLSASSIFFVSWIMIAFSLKGNYWRRFLPLNTCVMLTGIFWTVMNYCPQKHSFHLFTITMVITVLEAKFVLFSIRNGRSPYHYHFISGLTMLLMFGIVVDTTWENTWVHRVSVILVIAILLIYSCIFSFFHGHVYLRKVVDGDVHPIIPQENGQQGQIPRADQQYQPAGEVVDDQQTVDAVIVGRDGADPVGASNETGEEPNLNGAESQQSLID
ncbi:Protein CBG15988 [Caenorhabditis briggsae]|uniref:Protein CBG15988 n=1 Tax=Caenorhabditis briggsae TaxID=6238 RepID=A8XNC4_CAEBR|nr:Protein CBG15988 [Caenorhabditis briggsae]CAP34355.1 Protein CBG15988 [Caenorhabditis briggsae]